MEELKRITLYDEESDTQKEFELAGSCEMDGKTYWIVAELPEDEESPDPEEFTDEEEEDEEEESAAYLFRICGKDEAEFTAIDGKNETYVTSMMSDEEYDRVTEIFIQSDDFDLEIEEDEV